MVAGGGVMILEWNGRRSIDETLMSIGEGFLDAEGVDDTIFLFR